MKRLRSWFIGDYLEKTASPFERAKIIVTFDFSFVSLIFGILFFGNLIANKLHYHLYTHVAALLVLLPIWHALRYRHNVRMAAWLYLASQVIISISASVVQEFELSLTGAFFTTMQILFAFMTLGARAGAWYTLFPVALIILGVINDKMHGTLFNLHIPEAEKMKDDPAFVFYPIIANVYITWLFVKNSADAEKQLNKQKVELEQKNKEVTDSITYAERIQKAILPSQRLIEHYLPQSFVVYLPKDIVSGDFYWAEKKESKVFFAVVDCTGHGVPGAMMSVIGQNALNRVLNEFNLTQPSHMLDKLNELVEEAFIKSGADIRDGMDIALCALDEKTLQLEYAGANNAMYYVRGGELHEHKADKQPIGRFEKRFPFRNQTVQLQKGDCVYLFSDGIADQFGGPEGKKFKYKRLKALLQNTCGESALSQKNKLLSAFFDWKGKNEQIDDVCIFGVKI